MFDYGYSKLVLYNHLFCCRVIRQSRIKSTILTEGPRNEGSFLCLSFAYRICFFGLHSPAGNCRDRFEPHCQNRSCSLGFPNYLRSTYPDILSVYFLKAKPMSETVQKWASSIKTCKQRCLTDTIWHCPSVQHTFLRHKYKLFQIQFNNMTNYRMIAIRISWEGNVH